MKFRIVTQDGQDGRVYNWTEQSAVLAECMCEIAYTPGGWFRVEVVEPAKQDDPLAEE